MTPYLCEKVDFYEIDSPLSKFAENITSQNGEDGILRHIFNIIQPNNKYFVEFGAWDGKYLSNCFNLTLEMGWGGCFIEANSEKYNQLIENHGGNSKINCINKFVEFGGENSLDNILKNINAPKNFDLLSIDVDGTDYFIWESLEEFFPTIVIIEFNPTIPNDIIFVQEKNSHINQGCSLHSLIQLGKKKGYELICCTTVNAIFCKKEIFSKFKIKSNLINHLYTPFMDGRIFQGYDSYIFVHGMDSLPWKGSIPLVNEDFQVIPAKFRTWADAQG